MMTNTEQSDYEDEAGEGITLDQLQNHHKQVKLRGVKKPKSKEQSRDNSALKLAVFPERPALKFIPSPKVSH